MILVLVLPLSLQLGIVQILLDVFGAIRLKRHGQGRSEKTNLGNMEKISRPEFVPAKKVDKLLATPVRKVTECGDHSGALPGAVLPQDATGK
jgi:hypothetical protein